MADRKTTTEQASAGELERLWNAHWQKRSQRDPHSKAGSFRYSSSLELLPSLAQSLLDVGAGDGTFAFLAREKLPECRIAVLDRSPAAAAVAAGRGFSACVLDLDGPGLPYADGSFDVVTCLSVLQDIVNPWPLLAEMARVSRRWLIVSCPNFASISNRWDLLWGHVPRQMRFKTHLRFITFDEVTTRLQGLGLSVIDCRTRMKPPLLRSLPALPGLRKPPLAHRFLPNLASKFTVLAERVGGER